MFRRVLLSAASLGSLAVVAAACSGGGGGGGGGADLNGGLYEFTISLVANDLCWGDDNLVPPQGVGAIDLLVTASDAQITISPSNAARFYFQPLFGARNGDDLISLNGNGTLTVTSNCDVSVTTSGNGMMLGDNEFELSLGADLVAISSGTSGQCSALAGQDWPGATIPFPTLSEPTNGTCSVNFLGTAVLPSDE